jgi:hypothetical protein
MPTQLHTPFEFHYANFALEPYKGSDLTSTQLLKSIISKLNDPNFPSNKRVKDKHENRKGTTSRRLVHISSPFEAQGKRCFGKLALIKNKAPMTWSGKDLIEEIENPGNKEFIEVTNYVINFGEGGDPVIMVEFNHAGPRLSDIEYYFRQVSQDFRLATSIKSVLHLDTDYEQLDKELENVFDLTVKVNASTVSKSPNWLKSLMNIKDESGFKDVRLELFFKREKEKSGAYAKNILGLDYVRNMLGWLKKNGDNIEQVDDLKMTYQVTGSDKIVDLDFLKNKKTSIINIPLFTKTQYKPADFKAAVGQEFNHYLSTGKTHIVIQELKKDAKVP